MTAAASLHLHADALATLDRWAAPDAVQEDLRTQFCEYLLANADAMWRTCQPDHLTASALIMTHDARQVVLTMHAKANLWLQTGGHCEIGDASLAGAALREAQEESGIASLQIDPVPLLLSRHRAPFCEPSQPTHHLDVQFLAIAERPCELMTSDESHDVAWWPVSASGSLSATSASGSLSATSASESPSPTPTDDSVVNLIAAASTRLARTPLPSTHTDSR